MRPKLLGLLPALFDGLEFLQDTNSENVQGLVEQLHIAVVEFSLHLGQVRNRKSKHLDSVAGHARELPADSALVKYPMMDDPVNK